MGLVPVESAEPRLVPVDGPGPRLVPVDDPEPRLVPVDEPDLPAQWLGDPRGTGFPVEQGLAEAEEPQLPPGVYEYPSGGTYYRVQDGQAVPIGEKPVEGSMYDPGFDLPLDLMTGGLWGTRKLAGQALWKLMAPKAGQAARKMLASMGPGAIARVAGQEAAKEATWGGLAGAAMEATDQATGSKLSGLVAGLGAPMAARTGLTMTRKALGKGLESAAQKVAQKSWSWPMEGNETHGFLSRTLGTRAEAVGPDVYGSMLHKEAKLNRDLTRIQAEMGRYTLRPGLVEWLAGRRWMSPETGLILAQKARDAAGKIHPSLARTMGITPQEMITARSLAESMSGVDPNGVLQFGVKVKVKNADGALQDAWAHGLEPDKARELFEAQRPEVQRLVLAYRMPAGGYKMPVQFAPQGYEPGGAAVNYIQQSTNLDPEYLASELKGQGRNRWVGALNAGGINEAQAQLAADNLFKRYFPKNRGLVPVSGGQRPDQGQVSAPLGKESLFDLGQTAPAQGTSEGLVPLASDPLHQRLVKEGILTPDQYLTGYASQAGRQSTQSGVSTTTPDLQLNAVYEPMAQRRGSFREMGERLDETIIKQRSFAQEAIAQRQLLRDIAPTILQKAPKGRLEPEHLRRTRMVYDPAAKRMVKRSEVLSEVYVRPEEAEVLEIEPGRYLMPKALDDSFKVLMGRHRSGQEETVLAGAGRAMRDLATYWVMNVLSAPGTVATNALGGAAQYSSKWWEDLGRGSLRQLKNTTLAPALALMPSYRHMLPTEVFGEGSNLFRSLGEDSGQFMRQTRRALKEGEPVSKLRKMGAAGDAALSGALNANLYPFSAVEDFYKRSVFLSEARTMAEDFVDGLIKEGKADKGKRGELVKKYIAGMLDHQPGQFTEIMQGPVDRFAYLYQNTPWWLEGMRKNPFLRLIWPFPTYAYKYGRMVGSQLNAFNPFSAMPMKERAARATGLAGSAGAPYLALHAYLKSTGQESELQELQQRFREEHPGEEWPGTRTGGREFIGEAPPGPEGERRERYIRSVKYGPLAMLPLARGLYRLTRYGDASELNAVADEMKSVGPLVSLLGQFLELQPRYGARDVPGQAGELATGFIPLHRWLDYGAKMADRDPATGLIPKRTPWGFTQQIQSIIPGQRSKLHQTVDRVTGRPRTMDPLQESLKFLTGVNLRDVEIPRENRAVATFNLRKGKQWTKADTLANHFAGQFPEISYQKLMDREKEMLQAGQDQLRQLEQGLQYKGFKGLQEALAGNFDPFDLVQQEALGKLTRQAASLGAKSATGRPSLEQARMIIRLVGVNNWIIDHWNELKAE
ncbi:MAG: hypothetical protein KQH53_08260 [Desulfarculaceae bacterium]|nr:hypothetical protein [Desulfarculaceae bacterium]